MTKSNRTRALLLGVLVTAAAAPALHAQVFPHLQRSEVERKLDKKSSVNKQPDGEPSEEDGDSEERIAELRKLFADAVDGGNIERAGNTSSANGGALLRTIDRKKGRDLIEDYLEGRLAFGCQDFSNAERKLKKAEPVKLEAETPAGAAQVHRQIEAGAAFELRIRAEMMKDFDISKSADNLRQTFGRLDRKVIQPAIESFDETIADAEAKKNEYSPKLLAASKARFERTVERSSTPWVKLAESFEAAKAAPEDPDLVWEFVEAAQNPDSPMNIYARAAAAYLIKNFPTYSKVEQGDAAIAHANTLAATFEFQAAIDALKTAEARTLDGPTLKRISDRRVEIQTVLNSFKENFQD